ncbi:hypothetical protein SVIOM74S_02015 [Streptomyces violarus]
MLMRTDPFRELDRLTQQVFGPATRPWAIAMDAYRSRDDFFVHFDLPGIDTETIELASRTPAAAPAPVAAAAAAPSAAGVCGRGGPPVRAGRGHTTRAGRGRGKGWVGRVVVGLWGGVGGGCGGGSRQPREGNA